MEINYKKSISYRIAKKRVKKIRGFYIHLLVYLFVNMARLFVFTHNEEIWEGLVISAFLWGIGLFAHWATVFGPSFFFVKSWEDRKIREIMEKEEQSKFWK